MARIFPMKITNCHQCGHECHNYTNEIPPRVFFCRHPEAAPDFGFGVYERAPGYGTMNQFQSYPKIRENHTKTIGNIKIPDMCPLEYVE